jgi:hypothetical protein
MREASKKGPAVDLTEFERRLRSPEPVKRSGHDPLAELARLLHGDEAEPGRDPYRDVFAEQTPTHAAQAPRVAAPRASEPERPKFNEEDFLNDLRGSFEPTPPNPAPPPQQAPVQRNAPRDYPGAQRYEAATRSEAPQRPAAPAQRFEAPAQRFEAPPQRFEAPSQRFEEPPQRFEAPPQRLQASQRYDAPQRHEPAPQPRYDAPPQRFDAPPPRPRFEAPQQRYEAPQPYGGAPDEQTGYGGNDGWPIDESQSYLDYGPQGGEQDYDYEHDFQEREGGFRFRPWHAVAGIIVLGAVSIGWGFAHRIGNIEPQEIATIAAPEGPAKVPVVEGEAQQEPQGAAVLDQTENAAVTSVVTHDEQPVDPTVPPRALRLGAGQVEPQPPGNAATVPEPKKVKTVSVRPDGTIIQNDAVPPAAVAQPPSVAPPDPGLDEIAQIQGGTPKSGGAAPPAATTTPRAARPGKAPRIAALEPPAAENEEAAPENTVPENTANARGRGSFAVQFGAASSVPEARALMEKVASKYGALLGGRRLNFRNAKVGDKSVYRVRAGGASKEEAVSICEKVKASGGNCFVAPEQSKR